MKKKAFSVLFSVAAFMFTNCGETTFKEGALIYKNQCATCHMDDGSGLAGLIPPLAASDYLKNEADALPCLLRKGQRGPIVVNGKTYGMQEMPPMPQLSEVEITNVLNFVASNFGNQNGPTTLERVKKNLEACR